MSAHISLCYFGVFFVVVAVVRFVTGLPFPQ